MPNIEKRCVNDGSGIVFDIPNWLTEWEVSLPKTADNDEAAMQLALEVARLNIEQKTGGPFRGRSRKHD